MLLTEAAVHGAMAGFVRAHGPCWWLAAGDLHAPARNEPVRLRPRPLLRVLGRGLLNIRECGY